MDKESLKRFIMAPGASVYFAGIGGISMSGLAELMLRKGFTVSGSDRAASPLTDRLETLGARIHIPQEAENIDKAPIDLAVYTAALPEDHPELVRLREKHIPAVGRAEFLGAVMSLYPASVAVSGTHGKTTTTSMLSEILIAAGKDPTISLGGILPSIGGNFRIGEGDTFLLEACEYKNSFFSFIPLVGLILNIDADHLDFFKDLQDVRRSFHHFASQIPPEGTLVISAGIPELSAFTADLACRIVTFGEGGDYSAEDISFDANGCASFSLVRKASGKEERTFQLKVPGLHNVGNALAAIAASEALSLPAEAVRSGLSSFGGTERRFQYKGVCNGFTIIDDYAHHPTEIAATLAAAKKVPHKKLWVVFQPHTYSRTAALLTDFAKALSAADHVVLAEIYAAREENIYGVSIEDLRDEIIKRGTPCECFPTFGEIEKFLTENCVHRDLCITMGAGNVVDIGDELLRG